MISLGGLGAAPNAYQGAQARLYELQKQQADMQALASLAAGLTAVNGGGPIPGLPQQGGMPQQPQMPPQGGNQPPLFTANTNVAPLPGPTSNPNVDALTQALLRKGTGNATPSTGGQIDSGFGAQGFGSSGSVLAAGPAPAQVAASGGPGPPAPQQAAQPQIKLPSTAGIQPGTLSWASVVNAIKAANPTISPLALGTAVTKFLPFMQNDQAQQWKAIDEKRSQFEAETQRIQATRSGIGTGWEPDPDNPGAVRPIKGGPYDLEADVGVLADAIKAGQMPPPGAAGTSRFYVAKLNAPLAAKLAKEGFDLASHISWWNAEQKIIAATNSTPNTRLRAAVDTAAKFLDTFEKNVAEWNPKELPKVINKVTMNAIESGLVPGADQGIAARMKSQYADLISLLASVFQSGGVPTNQAFALAKEQVDLGWSKGTIDSVIEQIRGNLAARKMAIEGQGAVYPGSASANPYAPATSQPALAAAPPVAAAPAADPYGEGTQHRDSKGNIWTIRNGQYVQES